MKDKDRQEVADIVTQSMIKAGIVKPPKPKPQVVFQQPPQEETYQAKRSFADIGKFSEFSSYQPKQSRIRKFFGKKKPPSYSQIKFNEFMKTECKKNCYLCDDCEQKIRDIIKNAIEKDE